MPGFECSTYLGAGHAIQLETSRVPNITRTITTVLRLERMWQNCNSSEGISHHEPRASLFEGIGSQRVYVSTFRAMT